MDSEIPTPLAGRSPPGVGVAFLRNRLASIFEMIFLPLLFVGSHSVLFDFLIALVSMKSSEVTICAHAHLYPYAVSSFGNLKRLTLRRRRG